MNDLIPQTKVKQLTIQGAFGWGLHTKSQGIRELFKGVDKVIHLQSIEKPDLQQMDMRMNLQSDEFKSNTRPASPDNRNFIINSAPGTTNNKDFVKGCSSD